MEQYLGGVEPGWLWLAAALLLGAAEIVAPGVFMLWFGIAAFATGALTFALDLGFVAQCAVFAVTSIASVYAGRRYLGTRPDQATDIHLNDRIAHLIGEQVVVVEAIVDGVGRVRVGDGEWSASGPDVPVGTRMHIVGHDRGRLVVARGG